MTMEDMHFAAAAGDRLCTVHFIEQDTVEQCRTAGLFISGKHEGSITKQPHGTMPMPGTGRGCCGTGIGGNLWYNWNRN